MSSRLSNELMKSFIKFKSCQPKSFFDDSFLTVNQNYTLYILHNLAKNDKISLLSLRKNMNLAPSTITPIITVLEREGFILREIDKNDRRNIFIVLTSKGKEYTKNILNRMQFNLEEYIRYMGEDNICSLIKTINKTVIFFEERKKKDEKSI